MVRLQWRGLRFAVCGAICRAAWCGYNEKRFAARFAAPQNARVVTMPPPPQNAGGLPRRRSGYNKSGAARNETLLRSHHIFLNRLHSWKIINISKIHACKHYYKNLQFILALLPGGGFLVLFKNHPSCFWISLQLQHHLKLFSAIFA